MGTFTAQGSVAETEIWCDARLLQGVYRRGNSYQSVLTRLDFSAFFDTFRNFLTTNPQLNVQVRRRTITMRPSRKMTGLIRGVGYAIATIMGIAAVFGAILTISTLRWRRGHARSPHSVHSASIPRRCSFPCWPSR